jgi:type II secretory pathway component PulF
MRFIFTAKDLDDNVINGFVNANTKDEAVKMLQNKELNVISLNEENLCTEFHQWYNTE